MASDVDSKPHSWVKTVRTTIDFVLYFRLVGKLNRTNPGHSTSTPKTKTWLLGSNRPCCLLRRVCDDSFNSGNEGQS